MCCISVSESVAHSERPDTHFAYVKLSHCTNFTKLFTEVKEELSLLKENVNKENRALPLGTKHLILQRGTGFRPEGVQSVWSYAAHCFVICRKNSQELRHLGRLVD
jgi:hypothetical protein